MSETWLRVLLALAVPILWGVFSAWAFDRLRLRRACKTDQHTGQGDTR
jgi:hypothetical protein